MSKEDAGASSQLVHEESSQSELAALTAQHKQLHNHLRDLDKERHDLSIDTSRKDNSDQIKTVDRKIYLANQEMNTLSDQLRKAQSSSKTELGGVKQKQKQQEKPDNSDDSEDPSQKEPR